MTPTNQFERTSSGQYTGHFPVADIPADDEALRRPVRQFVSDYLAEVPPNIRARSWMGFDADFSRALAQQGWLGLTLPQSYGGGGRSGFARFVVLEELLSAGAPVSAHWIADRQSAPLILRYGTSAQRKFFLPRIIRGEAFFCIGMSEPDTGSDLASVRTRAEHTSHGWRLNGSKIWTTNAHRSHYMCALVRTSGKASDRHRGLSQVIIDMSIPGIKVKPITDITGDRHFCEVHFDNVELPPEAIVGSEGSGWEQVTAELAFERSGPERIYSSIVLVEAWLECLRHQTRVSSEQRALVGRIAARVAVLRAMSLSVTSQIEAGSHPASEAVFVKDLGTEFEQAVPLLIGELLNGAQAPPSSVLMQTLAYLTQISPTFSLRGGTRHILRSIIARNLGLR